MASVSTTSRPQLLPVAWVVWLAVLGLLLASGAFLGSCQPPATSARQSTGSHARAAHATRARASGLASVGRAGPRSPRARC